MMKMKKNIWMIMVVMIMSVNALDFDLSEDNSPATNNQVDFDMEETAGEPPVSIATMVYRFYNASINLKMYDDDEQGYACINGNGTLYKSSSCVALSGDGTANWTSDTSLNVTYTPYKVGVGIGLTSPQSLLHARLYATTYADALYLENMGNGAAGRGVGILFGVPYAGGSGVGAQIGVVEEGNAITTSLYINTSKVNVSSEKLRITSNGYVGINTTIPKAFLDVNGNLSANTICLAGDCRTSWPVDTDTTGGWTNTTTTTSTGLGVQITSDLNYTGTLYGSLGMNYLPAVNNTYRTLQTVGEALTNATSGFTANRIYFSALPSSQGHCIDQIGLMIGAYGAGTNCSVAIYDSDPSTSYPRTMIANASYIDMSSLGYRYFNITKVSLKANTLYYQAVWCSTAISSHRLYNAQLRNTPTPFGLDVSVTTAGYNYNTGYISATHNGSFPTTATGLTLQSNTAMATSVTHVTTC